MNLTKEQQAILDGEKGDVLSRIMKTLIRYGELFGAADRLDQEDSGSVKGRRQTQGLYSYRIYRCFCSIKEV